MWRQSESSTHQALLWEVSPERRTQFWVSEDSVCFSWPFRLQKTHSRVRVLFATISKIRPIGKGVSATVWWCEDIESGTFLAVKQVPMRSDSRCVSMVVEELVLCFGIDHPTVTMSNNVKSWWSVKSSTEARTSCRQPCSPLLPKACWVLWSSCRMKFT